MSGTSGGSGAEDTPCEGWAVGNDELYARASPRRKPNKARECMGEKHTTTWGVTGRRSAQAVKPNGMEVNVHPHQPGAEDSHHYQTWQKAHERKAYKIPISEVGKARLQSKALRQERPARPPTFGRQPIKPTYLANCARPVSGRAREPAFKKVILLFSAGELPNNLKNIRVLPSPSSLPCAPNVSFSQNSSIFCSNQRRTYKTLLVQLSVSFIFFIPSWSRSCAFFSIS